MHKIPTLILALFMLVSNLFATQILAFTGNQVSVSAIVLETIYVRQEQGQFIIETNSKNEIYSYYNENGRFVIVSKY